MGLAEILGKGEDWALEQITGMTIQWGSSGSLVVGTTLFSYAILLKLFLCCMSDTGPGVGHMKVNRIQTLAL